MRRGRDGMGREGMEKGGKKRGGGFAGPVSNCFLYAPVQTFYKTAAQLLLYLLPLA